MKSSTGRPFSGVDVTFLKYSPAVFPLIGAVIRGCSWAAGFTAIDKPTTHNAVSPAAVNVIRHERFISYPPSDCSRHHMIYETHGWRAYQLEAEAQRGWRLRTIG